MPKPGRYARRKYGSHHLRLVLCQIQFPVIQRFADPQLQATIQDALRADYPRVQQEQQVAMIIGPSGPVSTPGGVQWRYRDLQGTWSVVIQAGSAGLETTAYDRFEGFADRLTRLFELIAGLNITVLERVGLRYINEFRHENALLPSDWAGLLREDLLGIVGGDELSGEIEHAIQDIRLRQPDGTLVIRHGYVRQKEPSTPYYLLDLDYVDERPMDFDRARVLDQLQRYHEEISNMFEMSLSPEMRNYLDDEGPIDA